MRGSAPASRTVNIDIEIRSYRAVMIIDHGVELQVIAKVARIRARQHPCEVKHITTFTRCGHMEVQDVVNAATIQITGSVLECVTPFTASHRVNTRAAVEMIISSAAVDMIIAVKAVENIMSSTAEKDIITCSADKIIISCEARIEVDGHMGGRAISILIIECIFEALVGKRCTRSQQIAPMFIHREQIRSV